MKNIRRTLGTIVGLMLSLVMLSTQVYATGDFDEITAPEEQIVFDASEEEKNVFGASEAVVEEEPEVFQSSFIEVNPIYEGIITEEELARLIEANKEDEEPQSGLFFASDHTFTSLDEIGSNLKAMEEARITSQIEMNVSFPVTFSNEDEVVEYLSKAITYAERHTGVGSEGDYLRYNRLGQQIGYSYTMIGGEMDLVSVWYLFYHLTTYQQESDITDYLADVYSQLALDGKSEIEKIAAIYGYITRNVTYDWDNLNNPNYNMKYTTYAALIHGTAVCQGYATLLYRMMLDEGVDARVIVSRDHAWNIVRVGKLYYNVDSTWDSNYGNDPARWEYYLLCNSSFEDPEKDENGDHQREDEYKTSTFNANFPMAESDYNPDVPPVKNGIELGEDGKLYLYENGVVQTSFSGLYEENPSKPWWLIKNGAVDTDYNDLYPDEKNGNVILITNGKQNWEYTDVFESAEFNGWYYVKFGTVAFSYTGTIYSELLQKEVTVTKGKVTVPEDDEVPRVTDLEWKEPGWVVFTPPDTNIYYSAEVIDPDGKVITYSGLHLLEGTKIVLDCTKVFLNSGTYSAVIKTTSNSNDVDFSCGVMTEPKEIRYTRPDVAFDKPTNLRWLEDGTATWDAVPGNPYYIVRFYRNSVLWFTASGITNNSFRFFNLPQDEDYATSYEWTFEVLAYGAHPENKAASLSDMSYVYGDELLNGLHMESDGNWYLYENGSINYGYTGLYGDADLGWWLVQDGKVNFDYNDLYCDATVGWWLVQNGRVAFKYSDLYYSPTCGWWLVTDGYVNFGYTDLYYSPTCGWWKVYEGRVEFEYSDLYCSPDYGWWLVTDGYVNFGYTDLYYSPTCGWWKIYEGRVEFEYTELYGSPTCGWWLVENGSVSFGYTDLYYSPNCGWWLVAGGGVDFGYNDIYRSSAYGDWKVASGGVDFGFNGVYNSQRYGKCYVSSGAASF